MKLDQLGYSLSLGVLIGGLSMTGCVRECTEQDEQQFGIVCSTPAQTDTDPSTTTGDTTVGSPATTEDNVTTTMMMEDTTATDTGPDPSTGPPADCDGEEGDYDEDCASKNPNRPFCVGGQCAGCSAPGAAGCGGVAGQEVCATSGACVECEGNDAMACGGTSPICNELNECERCSSHTQCPMNAGCDLFEGSCLPPDAVADIAAEDLVTAINAIGSMSQGTIRVTGGNYFGPGLVIPGDSVIAIIGLADFQVLSDNSFPAVTVSNGGTIYLQNVTLSTINTAAGIEAGDGVNEGNVWMDDSTVTSSTFGIESSRGRLHLENTRIINNSSVGVRVAGSQQVTLRNVILAGNGTGTAPSGFVSTGGAPFEIVYTTIAQNTGTTAGGINAPSGEGMVRNSIVVGANLMNTDSIATSRDLTIINSAIEDDEFMNMSNALIPDYAALMLSPTWDISAGSIADNVAIWENEDPPTDINGQLRPDVDGTADYAGADLP